VDEVSAQVAAHLRPHLATARTNRHQALENQGLRAADREPPPGLKSVGADFPVGPLRRHTPGPTRVLLLEVSDDLPRPAMLVAMVTRLGRPACATTSGS
jgi:hypothetical protein